MADKKVTVAEWRFPHCKTCLDKAGGELKNSPERLEIAIARVAQAGGFFLRLACSYCGGVVFDSFDIQKLGLEFFNLDPIVDALPCNSEKLS